MCRKILATLLLTIGIFYAVAASAAKPEISITISSQHGKWEVAMGEMTSFQIFVADSNNVPLKNILIRFEIGPEMIKPYTTDSSVVANGKLVTGSYTLYNPGFLRCVATVTWKGQTYKKMHTVGYDPGKIVPTVSMPADFELFWEDAKKELANVPVDAKLELMPKLGSSSVDVYHVNIRNIGNSRLYGMLAIPKKTGKYPAVLQVPGAGVRGYRPDLQLAEKGVIVFTIGIHGIPVNLDSAVYSDLGSGALSRYFYFNLGNKDRFYYKRVYLGCVRAIDFLFTQDKFDKKNLGVYGGSQG
ncbi:MAG: acetylxylan esterase, partial [Gammaproteobacteria bacterium]